MDFVAIFLEILEKVGGLFPEEEKLDGLTIYSSGNRHVRIQVISTEEEFDLLFDNHHPAIKENFKKSMRCRLAAIVSYNMFVTQSDGLRIRFPNQLILNQKALPGTIRELKKELRQWHFQTRKSQFIEAYLISYVCHELRHILQLYSLKPKNFLSIFDSFPSLRGNNFDQIKLRRYWFQEIKYQISLYKKHYSDHPLCKLFIAIENDALYIQLLILDCWLNSKSNHEEKFLQLEEILWQKK